MKRIALIIIASFFLVVGCRKKTTTQETAQIEVKKGDIVNTIINDKESFYYVDFKIIQIMTRVYP